MSRTIYFLTCEKYFRELKKFLDWMPEDIYVRPSALTDILIDYLINGEVNTVLFVTTSSSC